jgi:hypothetical protein
MLKSRLLVTLIVCSWYGLQGLMFVIVRPELAYSYGHWLHGLGENLPALTASLSLPVLGPEISTANQDFHPVFWVVWAALLLPPLLLLRQAWRAQDRLALLETAFCWGAIYLLAAAGLAVLVALGLWLPFSAA